MTEDPNIVYVFVENEDRNVTMEDVSDWLGIIDEIESTKFQFDATSGSTCYQVRFRKSISAQQTVQYLSGSKLKNCTITIKSKTFQKCEVAPATDDGTNGDAGAASGRPKEMNRAAPVSARNISAILPLNDRLPPEVQMDAVLADLLPALAKETESYPGVEAFMQELLAAQTKLAGLLADIAEVDEQIQRRNEALEEVLAAQKHAPQTEANTFNGKETANGDSNLPSKPTIFSNSTGIAAFECSPLDLVSFLTKRFGPISQCECLINPQTELYFVSIQFMMPSDGDAFRQRIDSKTDGDLEQRKKSRVEVSLSEQMVFKQQWNVL
ncbi:unnamed protein product [Phytomonas sp. Hart1]|nr:unnamed protein product [Phytomonas sp. Hart1]|eukprot:CCW69122.1 unnamed protein product [Phytomonas sp. isolate Hart1]